MPAAPVDGNEKVVMALEAMLAEAKNGQTGFFIGCMVDRYGRNMGGWFGNQLMEAYCMRELEKTCTAMDADVINRTLPDSPADAPADRVVVSVPQMPMSFDFLVWLVDAEMTRRRMGAPPPLKVAFWFGKDGKTGLEDGRDEYMQNVIRPMLALVGAVEDDVHDVNGRTKHHWQARDIVAGYRAGEVLPPVRAPGSALIVMRSWVGAGQAPVTITLRETTKKYPHRNSDLQAWLQFAQWLRGRGENVIVVRDTAKADEPFDGFRICPLASKNLHMRAALYEIAKINLFVGNGPCGLAQFGDRPYLIFNPVEPDDHSYAPNTPKFWRTHNGIEVGEQWPWAKPGQRLVWGSDRFETLVQAWQAWEHEFSDDTKTQAA